MKPFKLCLAPLGLHTRLPAAGQPLPAILRMRRRRAGKASGHKRLCFLPLPPLVHLYLY